jgi:dihydroorotate dehydrogenase
MGNAEGGRLNPGIVEYMQEEFERVIGEKGRKHLLLSEVLEVHPHEDYPFDFRHLGVLFVCDRQLDGVFSLEDFEHFALWIQLNLSSVQMYEFKSQLQARTVAKVIETLERREGESTVVGWVGVR